MGSTPRQTGIAVVWGISTSAIQRPAALGSYLSYKPDEQSYEVTCQKELNHDHLTGAVIGSVRNQYLTTIRIRAYIWHTTLADAKGQQASALWPVVGEEIQLTDADDDKMAGYWELESISAEKRKDGKAFVDMTLIRHGDNDNDLAHGSPSNDRISSPVA